MGRYEACGGSQDVEARIMTPGEVFNPWKRFNGALVPESILSESGLGTGPKLLYGQLRRRAGERGYCWPGHESLAKDLGVAVRTVGRWAAALLKAGFIRITRRGLNRSNTYVFLWHDSLEPRQSVLSFSTHEEKPEEKQPEPWAEAARELPRMATQEVPKVSDPIKEEEAQGKREIQSTPTRSFRTLERVINGFGSGVDSNLLAKTIDRRFAKLGLTLDWAADAIHKAGLKVQGRPSLMPQKPGWFLEVVDRAADNVNRDADYLRSKRLAAEIRAPRKRPSVEFQNWQAQMSELAIRKALK